MNARRGFNRLFLVLLVCYYAIGSLWLYADWTHRVTIRQEELQRCFDAVKDPGRSGARIEEPECQEFHPALSKWAEAEEVGFFVVVPAVLYGFSGIVAWIIKWIIKGFRSEPKKLD